MAQHDLFRGRGEQVREARLVIVLTTWVVPADSDAHVLICCHVFVHSLTFLPQIDEIARLTAGASRAALLIGPKSTSVSFKPHKLLASYLTATRTDTSPNTILHAPGSHNTSLGLLWCAKRESYRDKNRRQRPQCRTSQLQSGSHTNQRSIITSRR